MVQVNVWVDVAIRTIPCALHKHTAWKREVSMQYCNLARVIANVYRVAVGVEFVQSQASTGPVWPLKFNNQWYAQIETLQIFNLKMSKTAIHVKLQINARLGAVWMRSVLPSRVVAIKPHRNLVSRTISARRAFVIRQLSCAKTIPLATTKEPKEPIVVGKIQYAKLIAV